MCAMVLRYSLALCLLLLPVSLAGRELSALPLIAAPPKEPIGVSWGGCPNVTCPLTASQMARSKLCNVTYPDEFCCGGDTGRKCITLSCGFAYSSAVSAPGGCAVAETTVTTAAFSKTRYAYLKKTAYDCFAVLASEQNVPQQAIYSQIESLSTVIAEAVALSILDAVQYICNKPNFWSKCSNECSKSSNQCKSGKPGSTATSIVAGRALSVGETTSVAVAEAFADAFQQKLSGDVELSAAAAGFAMAVSSATNTALVRYFKKVESSGPNGPNPNGPNCKGPTVKTLCAREVAKSVACAIAKATILYFGDDGEGNSDIVASQCSSSVGAAVSDSSVSLRDMIERCSEQNQEEDAQDKYAGSGDVQPGSEKDPNQCVCPRGTFPYSSEKSGKMYCLAYGIVADADSLPAGLPTDRVPDCGSTVKDGDLLEALPVGSKGDKLVFVPQVQVRTIGTSDDVHWAEPNPVGQRTYGSTDKEQLVILLPPKTTAFRMKCTTVAYGTYKMTFSGVDVNGLQTKVVKKVKTTAATNKLGKAEPYAVYFNGFGYVLGVAIDVGDCKGIVCSDFEVSTTAVKWPAATACDGGPCS